MAIEFNSKSKAYSEFSNFHVSPFVIDGIEWQTVEHYFQAQKFPDDPLQDSIRLAKTPGLAKKFGRTRSESFVVNWDQIKEDVMYTGLQAKFTQNPDLKDLLINTGDATLIEKSSWDSYWGIGKGNGKNRMGHLLMQLRDNLNNWH